MVGTQQWKEMEGALCEKKWKAPCTPPPAGFSAGGYLKALLELLNSERQLLLAAVQFLHAGPDSAQVMPSSANLCPILPSPLEWKFEGQDWSAEAVLLKAPRASSATEHVYCFFSSTDDRLQTARGRHRDGRRSKGSPCTRGAHQLALPTAPPSGLPFHSSGLQI